MKPEVEVGLKQIQLLLFLRIAETNTNAEKPDGTAASALPGFGEKFLVDGWNDMPCERSAVVWVKSANFSFNTREWMAGPVRSCRSGCNSASSSIEYGISTARTT